MAQQMSVKLSRSDASPWGFRLQGGKDFGSPLLIQKVNGGSPAERAGLQAGDAVIKVNNVEVFNMRHKEAQDQIVRAGNGFDITVQRGGSTWKPSVTPIGPSPVIPQGGGNITPVTKTSLAANKPAAAPIGTGHNYSPAPFAQQQMNGSAVDSVKSIVNKQYNTPVGIYSEETIAETLSAQAEVLAGGVLGVNFKKNERNYDPKNSEVFKMLNEIANEPRTPEPEATAPCYERPAPATAPSTVPFSVAGLRHVNAPEPRPADEQKTVLPPGQNICAECERLVVGVFVRIKDKNLHVECFKCATCGTSLKNVGYYNINNKLYCDVHAKLVARQHPPAPNLEPVTIPPGAQKPAGAISAALASRAPAVAPSSPQPSNFAPMPFHAPRGGPTHVQSPRPVQAPGGFTGVKPSFNAVAPSFNAVAPPPMRQPTTPTAPGPAPAPASFTTPAKPAPGGGSAPKGGSVAGTSAPVRGRGVLNQPGARQAMCASCHAQIRGPFVTALGKTWCPNHFVCGNAQCKRELADIGFVEEKGQLYCEYCFEQFIAPGCNKCSKKIKGDCLNAIGKHFHPECFSCSYCNKQFGNNPFFLEDGMPYCQADWNELFTTKCFACGFPIEAGDRWVEALNNNYHSQCFNCTSCKKNLEGQSFFAKSGRPFCKAHAR